MPQPRSDHGWWLWLPQRLLSVVRGALTPAVGLVLALTVIVIVPMPPAMALAPGSAVRAVPLHRIDAEGVQEVIGSLSLRDTPEGLEIVPDLRELPPGEHGFHLHALGSCGPGSGDSGAVAGLAAGGHWDPDGSGQHLGPLGQGHRGDLSRLVVGADGTAKGPVAAPRLRVSDLGGKALIVHAGGDTYTDTPPLGGGGARIACAVVPA